MRVYGHGFMLNIKKCKNTNTPELGQQYPPVQFVQFITSDNCGLLEKVPGGHNDGESLPSGQYEPTGHSRKLETFAPLEQQQPENFRRYLFVNVLNMYFS